MAGLSRTWEPIAFNWHREVAIMDSRDGSEKLTLNIKEVSVLLGVSVNSAYEAVRRGEIPAIRLGRRLLVPRRALENLLDGAAAQGKDECGEDDGSSGEMLPCR